MQTILLVSSCTIIIVILIALSFKSYPSIKKWLTTGKVNYFWLIVIFMVIFTFLTFPVFFSLWAKYFWNMNSESIESFGKLGPLGDIYGSLNAFVSSAALCAVAYSTLLQLKALGEAKNSSNNSALTDQFYSLMTFKNEMFYQLKFEKKLSYEESLRNNNQTTKIISGFEALTLIAEKIRKSAIYDDQILHSNYLRRLRYFNEFMDSIFTQEVNSLISYFYIHGELIKLINNAEVAEEVKESLKSILRNTMLQDEQIVLFYFASVFKNINLSLENSEIFNKFHLPMHHKLALKFHKESHFKSDAWKVLFRKNQTQPEPGLFD